MCGRAKSSQRQWLDSDIVQTRQGKLQGLQLVDPEIPKIVNVFKGIPFAKPPVGPLRFKKPQPLDNWEDVRAAKKWGPIAIQKLLFKSKELGKMSEDCLYLNVFAPTWKPAAELSSGFPVLVFIHGGGFAAGEAITYGDVGICKGLVSKDIIIVTIQYRLGYLGFWHTGDESIPSNLGLWDQTAALQWVHDNIGCFGGDAGNVTILVDKLMQVKANAFAFSMFTRKGFENGLECSPVFDGDFFPEPPAVLRSKAPNKPMMTGVTKFEGILVNFLNKRTAATVAAALKIAVPDRVKDAENKRGDLMRRYIPEGCKRSSKQVYKGQCELMSNVFFNAPTLRMVRETMDRSKGTTPVYLYTWDYCNPRSWGWSRFFMKSVDSSHGTELAYLFGKSCIFPFKFNEHDCAMCDVFTTAFVNFAKYGNPNGSSEDKSDLPIAWPQISSSSPERHIAFNVTSTTCDQFFDGIPATILAYQE